MSLPLAADVLEEYAAELPAAVAACGCDGLEGVWGGVEPPWSIPEGLRFGYHLTFYPDWLDFWRGDRAALMRKFGSEPVWRAFYGGAEGEQTLLDLYRADLKRALAWGARYVVFHVSDVSIEEGYTYRWEHSHAAVIDAAAELANRLLDGRDWPFQFLVENQWWPGFTFTDPALTGSLLEKIHFARKGILLDTGHMMNTDRNLRTQAEGAAYIHRMLDAHGTLCRYIKGVHLHQSLSGPYVRAHTGALPPLPEDYLERFAASYRHILNIDTHRPWTDGAVRGLVERIAPDYLVHELCAHDRASRAAAVRRQNLALGS